MPKVFTASGDFSFGVAYYPEPVDYVRIDREIRHMPGIIDYTRSKAREMLGLIDSHNFSVVEAGGDSRYRAYVIPNNRAAELLEASMGVLEKAAVQMEGR